MLLGVTLGEEIEADFTRQAVDAGMSESETTNAYNKNMIDAGGLSLNPVEFATQHNRKWMLSDFEAGDVVLHNPFTVSVSSQTRLGRMLRQ